MPVNIEEIKKLSAEEKIKLIDEIWESIEDGWESKDEPFEEPPEIEALLEERLADIENGKAKSYTWEEAKAMIEEKLRQAKK